MSHDYPTLCTWCGSDLQTMAHGDALPNGGRKVVMVCERCDGPTLETMWGPAADQAAIDAWVEAQSGGGR